VDMHKRRHTNRRRNEAQTGMGRTAMAQPAMTPTESPPLRVGENHHRGYRPNRAPNTKTVLHSDVAPPE